MIQPSSQKIMHWAGDYAAGKPLAHSLVVEAGMPSLDAAAALNMARALHSAGQAGAAAELLADLDMRGALASHPAAQLSYASTLHKCGRPQDARHVLQSLLQPGLSNEVLPAGVLWFVDAAIRLLFLEHHD